MYKKGIVLLLCFLLLAAAFPVKVSAVAVTAVTQEEKDEVYKEVSRGYRRALYSSGKESLVGYCGLMAGWQLYFMGINKEVIANNGNLQYDYYLDKEQTSGGYPVKVYSAKDYTLSEALYAMTDNGKRNVYNMLVGFQRTNTTAGSLYGHAVVVQAVLDGMVYFTEGFQTSLGAYPGAPIVVSIDRFAEFYDEWTTFEGIILFGNQDYMKNCIAYASNMFVEVTRQAQIYSLPCEPEESEVEVTGLRTVVAGERLLVTGLYENTVHQYYYRVKDDGQEGYVLAEAAQPLLELEQGSHYIQDGQVFSGINAPKSRTRSDGWIWEQNTWRYYAHGEPRTGWFCDKGVDYYLQADGSVTTGWKNINGKDRYFSDTGAMRTGWMDSAQGRCFFMSNGAKVTGWRTIEDKKYYFDNNGILQSNRWLTENMEQYYLFPDGSAATGWVDLEEGHFFFYPDGQLSAQTIQNQDGIFVRAVNAIAENIIKCSNASVKTANTKNNE